MKSDNRIYLSPPQISKQEIENVTKALESGWIAPIGTYIDSFTEKLSHYFNKKVLLTNNGTSALHLSLNLANVQEGDYVLCSNFTFAATAFPILYQKAIPIFIGSEKESWNLSPIYLKEAIEDLKKKNIHPKALIIAHIYGMPALIDEIISICKENNILIIEDAAEAMGSEYKGKKLGSLGDMGIVSFNGNKIITCSSGGALILPNKENWDYAKKLSTQAKENVDFYLHNELGYNYAQSNILAAIGNTQFENLNQKIEQRRSIFNFYLNFFNNFTEVEFQKENKFCFSNRWLSSFIFKNKLNKKIKDFLDKENIESRYLWNPLHKQKVFKIFPYYGNEELDSYFFENGLSLPSGNNLTKNNLDRILTILTHSLNTK